MSTWVKDITLISLLVTMLFGLFLGSRPLTVPDEGRYAEIPREMLINHDYITPKLNGIKYFEKPILFYWMQALSIKIFNLNLWSIRLANAFMGLLGCLMCYVAGRKLYSSQTGFLAALILATSGLYFSMAHLVTLDMTLAATTTACLFSFLLAAKSHCTKERRAYLWAAYSAAGLATLTKGLVGFLLPGAVVVLWLTLAQEWRHLKQYLSPTGILLFLAITVPWHALVQHQNHEFAYYYFLDQQFLRYFNDHTDRSKPFWFMPTLLFVGLLPWSLWCVQAIKQQWPTWQARHQSSTFLFLIAWAGIIFTFYWYSHSQLAPYLLPIFPPLALIIAQYFVTAIPAFKGGASDIQLSHQSNHLLGLGFIGYGVMAVGALVAGLIHFGTQSVSMNISLGLISISGIATTIAYQRYGGKTSLITLMLTFSLFILSLNISAPPTDVRGIKPLADKLQQLAKPGETIATYQHYYQDLPVYLNHTVLIVNWYGELKYGIFHQNTSGYWIDEKAFWQRWKKPERMYMILSLKDFKRVTHDYQQPLFEIARTEREMLVTNRKMTP